MKSGKYAKKDFSKSYRLERSTMDKIFGKRKWRSTTIANKADFFIKKKENGYFSTQWWNLVDMHPFSNSLYQFKCEYRPILHLNMVCNWILYLVDTTCPYMAIIVHFVMQKMSKITYNFLCKKWCKFTLFLL